MERRHRLYYGIDVSVIGCWFNSDSRERARATHATLLGEASAVDSHLVVLIRVSLFPPPLFSFASALCPPPPPLVIIRWTCCLLRNNTFSQRWKCNPHYRCNRRLRRRRRRRLFPRPHRAGRTRRVRRSSRSSSSSTGARNALVWREALFIV